MMVGMLVRQYGKLATETRSARRLLVSFFSVPSVPPWVKNRLYATNLTGGLFDLDNLAAFIVAALGAGPMWQLTLVAIGTFGQGLRRQMIVGAALGRARLGMAPFWIWHENLATSTAACDDPNF